MAGKPGSERVGYLGELPIGVVLNEKMNDNDLLELVSREQFHIVIRKDKFDLFSNPNAAKIMELLKPKKVVVFGAALDLCVRQAIEGLSRFDGIKVYLLRDAVKTLGLKSDREVIAELTGKGVEVISVSDLKRKF
jgi:nicotinamidase-related amidase